MYKLKPGFTMIELIFVILIIGILAAVAIPRIAENKTSAVATSCVADISNIITEITTTYMVLGYSSFQTATLNSLTNVKTGVGTTMTGIIQPSTNNIVAGINYNCDGGEAVSLTFGKNTMDPSIYEMSISTATASTTAPSSIKAVDMIEKIYNITPTRSNIIVRF